MSSEAGTERLIPILYAALWNSGCCCLCYPVLRRGLRFDGLVAAWLLGCLLLAGFGWKGYIAIAIFFLGGTLTTKLGRRWTKMKHERSKDDTYINREASIRGANSVLSSGCAGAFCAIVRLSGMISVSDRALQVAYVSSLASKIGDTVSSEIGKSIGTKTYLITTLKRVERGTEGAISVEGSMSGLGAVILYVLFSSVMGLVNLRESVVCFVSALIANVIESVLGASIPGSNSDFCNDIVNAIQVCLAAIFSILLRNMFDW